MELNFDTFGNEKQKAALKILLSDPDITELGYGGAAGGAKSYTLVAWVWIMCNQYPGIRAFFGRRELKRLKQSTLATYYKFCGDYNIPEEQRGKMDAQNGVIRFANGSEILLLDLAYQPSDPLYTRFGSVELTLGGIDEAAEVDEKCIMILKTRVGRQKNEDYAIPPRVLLTFNPDKGHVYRNFYKPWKEGTLPKYRAFIAALPGDNKRLPKSYIESLKQADEVTQQRLLYGNFDYDDTPGRLFDYAAICDIWTNPKYNGEGYITCDAARKGKDKAIILVWNGLEVIDHAIYTRSTNEQLQDKIREFQQKYKIASSRTIIDEDGVGGGIVDNLHCAGFINNSRAVSPGGARNTSFLKRNFANLKTQCYFELARYVNGRKICFRTDDADIRSCLSDELDIVVQVDLDKDSNVKIISKEEIKNKLGRSPDWSDVVMMRMWFELNGGATVEIGEYEKLDELDPYVGMEMHEIFPEYEDEDTFVRNISEEEMLDAYIILTN